MTSIPMRRAARLTAALVMALGLGLVGTAGAGAAAVDAVGWWWRPNSTAVPIEVPPRADVGPDEVLVEGEPEGASAVAAVRYKLGEGETNPILTVVPTEDSALPTGASVLACRVTSPWVSAQGGKWEARAFPDCLTSVQGIRGSDGKLVFALAPLQSGPTLEVVITPAQGAVFSLKFLKPTAADLKTTTDGTGTATGGSFASPDPSSFGADSDSGSSTSSGTFDSGSSAEDFEATPSAATTQFASPAFSQPSSSSFTPPPTVPVAAAAPSGVAPVAAAPNSNFAPAPIQAVPAANTSDTKKGRTLGVLVLLAGAAIGFWAYSGSLMGGGAGAAGGGVAAAGAEPVLGGLGRFSRPRNGPPPTLG